MSRNTRSDTISTINLRRLWTSAFFRLASGTVGFSPRLKNSGHVITFLRCCSLQNTNHVMPFWLWTACLIFPPLSKSRGRKDVKDVLYLLRRQLWKMHQMKKERFQLITYQETIDYQLECMLLSLQFKLYMLELWRSWTSRQSDDVFHQRRENSFTSRNKAQRPKQQNTCLLCRYSYRKN